MMGLNLTKCNVSDFLEQYRNQNTKSQYRANLKHFFVFIYPELDSVSNDDIESELDKLSLQYFEDERDIRKDLVKYTNTIQNYAPKTRSHKLNTLFRYLEDNGLDVPKTLRRNLIGQEIMAISEEYVPKPEDLKRVLEHLDIADKALVLVLSSSGMRVGECLKLTLDDIDLDHTPAKISLPAHITKQKRKRVCFISDEAKQMLVEDWLPFRLEYRKRACAKGKVEFDPEEPRLFPFSYANIIETWKRGITRAGFTKRDPRTKRMTLRLHSLRKYFRTHGRWQNPDIPEALMGHQGGLVAIYARFDQALDILIEGYLTAMPNLSVSQNSKTLVELRDKVDKQSDDIQELVTNLSLRNARLENEMVGIRAEFTDTVKAANHIWEKTDVLYQDTILEMRERMVKLEDLLAKNLSKQDYFELVEVEL